MSTTQTTLQQTAPETNETTTFSDRNTRKTDMSDTIEAWISDLTQEVKEANDSDELRDYLDTVANFHNYSRNNQLLIALQNPDATRVAGFNTWKNDFNRTVKKGEKALYIWAPSKAKTCPDCGHTETYTTHNDCDTETDPENWETGIVGFRPVPVFDISQTEGEPVPELDTETRGDADDLPEAILATTSKLGIPSADVIDPDDWTHGRAKGICEILSGRVEVLDTENDAEKASVLIHEFAHSMLHSGVNAFSEDERAAREVEAESVAYAVNRHFNLSTKGSAFYLAAWNGDNPDQITERLERISSTAQKIIENIEAQREE